MEAAFLKNIFPRSGSAGTNLLEMFAIVAVLAFGSVAFGPALAAECVVVGLIEETIFTGIVFTVSMRYFSKTADATTTKAAVVTALLFALCHLAYLWKVPMAFAFSLCMVWLYRRTRSLAWPICVHAVFDMLWFGLFALP